MLLLERDKNLAIHRADGGRIAERDVDAAIREADVVENDVDLVFADDLPDRMFDLGEIALRILEPRGGRRPDMQTHLAGVYLREKVLTKLRKKRQRTSHQQDEEHAHDAGARDTKGDAVAIALAQPVEASFETVVDRAENIELRARRRGVRGCLAWPSSEERMR